MEADTIDGSVAWDTHGGHIVDCWFRGGPGSAMQLFDTPRETLATNRIEDYETGITISDPDVVISGNDIVGCGTGVVVHDGESADLEKNTIRNCGGIGIEVYGVYDVRLTGNVIVGTGREGAWCGGAEQVVADRNIVGECGGAGIFVTGTYGLTIINNTVFSNDGAGIELENLQQSTFPQESYGRVLNNIGFANQGWGLSDPGGKPVELGCNDWFANGPGSVGGVAAGSTDLSLDPMFCDVKGEDVRLGAGSPLVGIPSCGQIGALGVGCGVTATLLLRFTAERVSDEIRIVWQVAEGATATAVWLERAEAMEGPAWIRPLTERSVENLAVVELDRSAASDRIYWYRLVALEGNRPVVIGPPIVVEGEARPDFRLEEVGPNPVSGPVRIGFALRYAAPIEIDVFDVQGRIVASPGRGVWAAGAHIVVWDGKTRNGEVAAAGLYLLRYSHPGGQDRRAIVRTR